MEVAFGVAYGVAGHHIFFYFMSCLKDILVLDLNKKWKKGKKKHIGKNDFTILIFGIGDKGP